MEKVWLIFKYDIKRIFTNVTTVLIICGLIVLPSLYAWFNIKANWDPYGATSGIKVAVVNLDEGTTLLDKQVNVGDEIVSALKENDKLGWTFVSAEDADYGVKTGKFYASITIPNHFSSDLATLTTSAPVHPELVYVINEKINAIAPKITSSGATTLKTTITENIVSTINEIFLSIFNNVGEGLNTNSPQIEKLIQMLLDLNTNQDAYLAKWKEYQSALSTAGDTLTGLQGQLPTAEDTLTQVGQFAQSGQDAITGADDVMAEISDAIETSMNFIVTFNKNAIDFVESLSTHLEDSSSASSLLNFVKESITAADNSTTVLITRLEKLNIIFPNQNLSTVITGLNTLRGYFTQAQTEVGTLLDDVATGKDLSLDSLSGLKNTLQSVTTSSQNILSSYQNTIAPNLKQALSSGSNALKDVSDLTSYLQEEIPTLKSLLTTAKDFTDQASKLFASVNTYLTEAFDRLNTICDKLSFLADGTKLSELIHLLENNPSLVASYIASPVTLKQESIYSIPNYGSAMTPFYSTLAIWVGVVILTAVLSTHCEHEELKEGLKPIQEYVGKAAFFLLLSLLQTLIIILGDKYILGVYFDNFGAFLLVSLFGAATFTAVIYTLVSVFGNIGKGITIILLVLQISSSGGTFPVEVIPRFFQKINPFLPFTYVIQALREAQGGIVRNNLIHDLTALGIFIIVFLLVVLVLKPLLNQITHNLSAAFHKSHLGE